MYGDDDKVMEGEDPMQETGPETAKPQLISTVGLVGDLTEESANEILSSFLLLRDIQTTEYLDAVMPLTEEEATEELLQELKPNIDFYISTNGGNADEMFGLYDIMRMIKGEGISSISTCGIGKVMSAGVLLLAAGTKGKRRIGKHCRVMIHSVIGGSTGSMHQILNEVDEIKKVQDIYIKALVAETSLTEKELRRLLKKKVNIYLSAEEAVKMGIADEVF